MSPIAAKITGIKHRFTQVNGIKMHIAEQGEGPLVVLAHGWPEPCLTSTPPSAFGQGTE
jgi:hypothetical protein